MRNFFALALHVLPLLCLPIPALAGNQVEERLSDSARSSLQASIADRAVPVLSFDSPTVGDAPHDASPAYG